MHDEGAENLTMRGLAKVLDSTAMAVYHHVRDKDQLLALVLEYVAQDLPRPPLPEDPRQRLVRVCELMRDAFTENPWVVPVLAHGELFGVSAIWMTEEIIGALVDCGLTRDRAFWTHQTIWHYTAGLVLYAAPRTAPEPDGGASVPHYPEKAGAGQPGEAYPHLAALAADSRSLEARYTYHLGIRHILDGALFSGSVPPEDAAP